MNATPPAWLGIFLAASIAAAGEDPPSGPAKPAESAASADEQAIRATIRSFAEAFAKGDAKAIAGLFTEGAEAVDHDGNAIRGREALEAHYAGRFASTPGDRIEGTIEGIHFLAPGLARLDGRARLVPADGGAHAWSKHALTLLKGEEGWRIASIGEVQEEEIGHHARLEELGWLVGDWVEESGHAVIVTSMAWSDDGNYLLRSFEVRAEGKPAVKGTQRIGWDPLTRQVKSWTFDSQGGTSEGHWARGEDRWVVKSTGVRPDGLTTSATQVLTRLGKDRILWKSTDRSLGGEPVADLDEIVMVRKPPEPK